MSSDQPESSSPYTDTLIYKYTDIQVHRYTGTRVHQYAGTPVQGYTDTDRYTYQVVGHDDRPTQFSGEPTPTSGVV